MRKFTLSLVLMAALLASGQQVQAKSAADNSTNGKTCPELWPVNQGEKWGYIDKTGRLIIPFKFDWADDFSEGLAAVKIKEKAGYIDKTGKFVIPPRFFFGGPFSSGMALVVFRRFEKDKFLMNKLGYIDRSGKLVIQSKEALDSRSLHVLYKDLFFSEGLACMDQNNKFGFIDKAGKQVIPPQYEDVRPYSEGLAAVVIKDKYGYIDKSGKMVIPPQFEDAGPFSEGLAAISFNGKQSGYIDKSGRLVINGEEFGDERKFSEGLAAVSGKNGKYGFIDKTGKFVIQPQFEHVGDFSEGLAPIRQLDELRPGDLAYINQKGEMVIQSMWTFPNNPPYVENDLHNYRFCGGVAQVWTGNEADEDAVGYINQEGKFIWPKVTPSKKE